MVMKWILLAMLVFCSGLVSGWEFTEIMANPQGSDSGKEWVELLGDSLPSSARFVEDGGSHRVSLVSGDCLFDCILIIADDAAWFLSEYSVEESVLVYDSSWSSLRNSGEQVSLVVGEERVDLVYEMAISGKSLQKGVYKAPTPGFLIEENVTEVEEYDFFGVIMVIAGTLVFLGYGRYAEHMN